MDPNSSIGKTCLGEYIIDLSSEKTEGHGDWNSIEYQDTTNSGAYDGEINLGKEENMISNEFAMKLCLDHEFIINPEEDDVEPGVVLGRLFMCLTKGITDFGNGIITIYPELDPFLDRSGETKKIDDDWDLLLDDLDFGDILEIKGVEILPFVCKMRKNNWNKRKQLEKYQMIYSNMGQSLSTKKPLTQEEAAREALAINICRRFSKLEEERPALIEKEDPGAFVILIQLEAKINLNALADTGFDINVMPYRVYKNLGKEELKNVNRGITMLNHLKAEPMGLLKDVLCQRVIVIMRKIIESKGTILEHRCMDQSLAVSFLGSLPVALQHEDWKPKYTGNHSKKEEGTMGTHDDKAGSSQSKRSRQYETVEEAILPRVHHPFFLWEGCTHAAKSLYNTKLAQFLPRLIHSPCVINWNMLNHMGCGEVIDEMLTIKLSVAGNDEEIFTSEAWTMDFKIDDPIYSELCHEFYFTYEFDEVCADDELRTKKIIKFRLCGRAFSWTLLEFARRLELYHSDEINEEGFDVYFQGCLRSDEHFNAREYWLSISREENLSLSRSHTFTIWKPVLRVLHKMITYGLYQRTTGWMKRKGASSKKESMICCGQFITKIAKRKNLMSNVNSLSAPIYCRVLDTTTLRELIDSEGRLIPEVLEPGVPRVAIPRPIESIDAGFHMAEVYDVPLQGACNPPGYDQQ
ncbi:hypothetical protein Tco_0276730 [Tanacetum coccineum]